MDSSASSERSIDGLTSREQQVLNHLAAGKTNIEIAAELHVSVHAIKYHLQHVFRKLGVTNRTEAVVAFLVPLDRPQVD
jgi:DNA-binding NarL/FixJ family response regulator